MSKLNPQQIAKYTRKWLKATLMDDLKFRMIAKSKKAIQEILRVILNDDMLEVLETIEQRNRGRAYFHGVILDCECRLSTNEIVNIEVQIAFNDNPIYRMRYNQSVLTIENSPKQKDFRYKNIPKIISIMFCEFDIFKKNEPIYEIYRKVNKSNVIADNGIREIYVNLKAVVKDTRLKQLFKIITTADYKNEKTFPELSKQKDEITNLIIGGRGMSGLTLEIFKDGKKVGKEQGIQQGMKQGMQKGMKQGIQQILKYVTLYRAHKISLEKALTDLDLREKDFLTLANM